ncbi:DUF932 domain-containing protein [Rhodoplanes sp. TEM]|uniref:DUF932 domain-containing protein n=1 Tax=Rhodoplanes tepidamans TaxID=200616 RepID=A0ABT5J5A1_RHOTP|nr:MULTISPECIES: DUF932 domain-containing protein [Rhodoplanes]MDC7784812.1 DUF932 domain-containing protein [Rhodoplanes tepidamans]MDC7982279.1 DUF932 domain-containing protein [Rhodoplanes sp. TEM]MDQ0356286.1 hypothetical protein [Rhodoplanes tepidamans]
MQAGLDLVALAQRIAANSAAKNDFVVDTRQMEMRVGEDGGVRLAFDANGEREFSVRPVAHDQIGQRLQVPARYYNRMLEGSVEERRLLARNVNHWFSREPERRMVRTLDSSARAFLSDRYRRIDHEDIADSALQTLAEVPGVQVVSTQLTEARLYIQAVTPRLQAEVKVGDVVEAGVIVRNSEIGLGSVSIAALVRRLVCLNGAVVPDNSFRAYHVGRRIEEDGELQWADDTRQADDAAIRLKVRDMVRAAFDEARFAQTVDRMRRLAGAPIKGDPVKAVELLAKKVGATEGERTSILQSLIRGGDLSAWGLMNAVTHQAHTVTDYDRSVEFEQAGGALINLPSSEWKEVLEAA